MLVYFCVTPLAVSRKVRICVQIVVCASKHFEREVMLEMAETLLPSNIVFHCVGPMWVLDTATNYQACPVEMLKRRYPVPELEID
jgi:hypothetical protein